LLNHDDPRCQSFPPSYDITQGIDRIRWKIFQQIESQVLETTVKGPLLALLLGESQWITGEQWKLLRDTGTIHLLAISGLHIGLAALIGFYLGSFIMKVVYMVRPSMTCQRLLPPLVSISVATSYALLAGLSLPTQRALVMVVLFYTGTVMCRRLPVGYLLGSALLWIALSDPLAMTSAGFWLSFLAVSVLLYGYQGRKVSVLPFWLRYWQELLQTQWLLLIGLALVSLIWLQGISVSSPLANIFAVTLVSLCIVPLLFVLLACWLLALPGAYLIIWFLERLVALLWWGLGIIDQKAPAFWFLPVSEPPWYSILLCSIGVIWLLAPKGIPYRYLGVIGFFPVLFSTRPLIPLSLTFLDVGQGTAVVVQTAQHTLVYDTGPSYSSRFNAGQHILAPYLRSIGARKVNTLVVSHSDYDHAGGLLGLLESSHVDTLLSGQPNVIQKRLGNSAIIAPEVDACQAGQSWQWDHVTFTILWPSTRADFPSLNNNNSSCVLLIEYKDHKILLAGDIERRIESWLLQHYRQQLEAVEIVLVPHHGSGTSSSQAWVNTLLPQWSVISAGYRNRYRHPNDQVVARYQRANSMILNTATVGAVRFTLLTEAKKWQLEKWREDYRRYWH
jgi:competence protein ComEC